MLPFCGSSEGSTAKKWFVLGASARVNWDSRKGQQLFRPNPNGVGDSTITLRRQLIGASLELFVQSVGQETLDSVACFYTVLQRTPFDGNFSFYEERSESNTTHLNSCSFHLINI